MYLFKMVKVWNTKKIVSENVIPSSIRNPSSDIVMPISQGEGGTGK
jgi:hypothetical protein